MATLKKCSECSVEKDIDLFDMHPKRKFGRRGMCKECRSRNHRDAHVILKSKGVFSKRCPGCLETKPLEGFSPGHSRCKPCLSAKARERRAANPEIFKERFREHARRNAKSHQAKRYGTTVEHIESLAISQGGKCAICHKERKLVVDHCHETGVIRGLLCRNCNSSLGHFGDNVAGLEIAINYLKKAKPTLLRAV